MDREPSRTEHSADFPFMEREELTRINDAFRQGERWKELWHHLNLPDPSLAKESRPHDFWGISPFNPMETKPSFHMNAKGWYCHSTQRGGKYVNLAAELWGVNVYYAAHLLREALLGGAPQVVKAAAAVVEHTKGQVEDVTRLEEKNRPIRVDLRRLLSPTHPEFERRGIPAAVLEDLGAGYLDRPPRKGGGPDPLNHRLVFQVRGIEEQEDGYLRPVILTHMGRATTREQEQGPWGKWYLYPGFRQRLELFNLDQVVLDDEAEAQISATDHVLVVEGPMDVAKLYAAGVRNVVATFGAHLSPEQIQRLDLISEMTGVGRFLFFYDRDQAGVSGMEKALGVFSGDSRTVQELGHPRWVEGVVADLEADGFDWNQTWSSPQRSQVGIPEEITDPAEFSVEQLQWLRRQGLI